MGFILRDMNENGSSSATNADFNSLDALVQLARIQRARVESLYETEQRCNVYLRTLDESIKDYCRILMDIHRIQLGPYKWRGQTKREQEEARSRENNLLQKQVLDAVTQLEDIFKRRTIHLGTKVDNDGQGSRAQLDQEPHGPSPPDDRN
jgi:hypothetical protein